MFCLWLCLGLLCAAASLQSSVSSYSVSLKCNQRVEVVAAQTATLNCTIITQNCTGVRYYWYSTRGNIPCNSGLMKYNCEWDHATFVSLTISNITEEENYTVSIQTDCGVTKPSTIRVQVSQHSSIRNGDETSPYVRAAILGVFGTFIVAGILIGIDRGRKIMKKKKKTRGYSDMGAAPGSDGSLTA